MPLFIWFIPPLVLGLDRWLKAWVLNGQIFNLGPFSAHIFRNEGLLFSTPAPWWLGVTVMAIGLVVVGWLMAQALRQHQSLALLATTLLFFGAASNLYDRIAYRAVIDVFDLGRWWPVFNVADMLICGGLILWLLARRQLTARGKDS